MLSFYVDSQNNFAPPRARPDRAVCCARVSALPFHGLFKTSPQTPIKNPCPNPYELLSEGD